MQGLTLAAIGTGSQCVREKYVKDNNYAQFDTSSYHHFRETHKCYTGCKLLTDEEQMDQRMGGKSNSYVAPCYKQVQQTSFQLFRFNVVLTTWMYNLKKNSKYVNLNLMSSRACG